MEPGDFVSTDDEYQMLTNLFSIHKLTKPSAFEVSKLDQCRTVIDLYEQVDMDYHRRLK